ncbi:hypothetical protein [Streptomyces sp. URMC 123]|uniref:hypothetical protein n=1 Tax=Streptomyces sp. URMC 123 TaxID=3423403 RepID=UPI003F1B6635
MTLLQRAGRWLFATPPRIVVVAAVSLTLLTVGYLRIPTGPSYGCPRPLSRLDGDSLVGDYTGSGGMRITLHPSTFSVENWPSGDIGFHGADSRLPSGSGRWSMDTYAGSDEKLLRLSFEGGPGAAEPKPLQFLAVGGDRGHRVLFDDEDPDVCPDTVLTRAPR